MRILIANRGEIACRIIKTIKKLEHESVLVYSSADKNSKAVKMADISVCIGSELASNSYLNMFAILTVATSLEVDAIHPGYGFLSENSVFASLCENLEITFIGPSSKAIKKMGDKINALSIISEVQSFKCQFLTIENEHDVVANCCKIGLPVIIKYAQGGGGKGMRIVRAEEEIVSSYNLVLTEAMQSSPNPRIFVEKFIENAKHIEVQLIADKNGNVKTLGTRDCTLQRKGQKVIEEAPAKLSDETANKINQIAIDVARKINYLGVGTIEFLVENDNVYFLEMNTRLQVEHTVTEEIFDIDLIALQINVANGYLLDDLNIPDKSYGHSIECRINAEDPANNFMPSPKQITSLQLPIDARVDFGYEEGDIVSPYYDSMIGKLIVKAKTREEAISKMKQALKDTKISGISTNIEFNLNLLEHEKFNQNTHDTQLITREIDNLI